MSESQAADFSSWTFEQLVGELEAVTKTMEAGDLGIEDAVALYERAGSLHEAAFVRLHSVQARVEQLRQVERGS